MVEPVIAGLTRTLSLGPGVVTVDRFGHDPVETSTGITELAAEILGRVLTIGSLPTEAQAIQWLEGLP